VLANTLSWFNVVFAYRDHGIGPHTVVLSLPDPAKVIQVFQIEIQTKNYIAKYNANAKTESC